MGKKLQRCGAVMGSLRRQNSTTTNSIEDPEHKLINIETAAGQWQALWQVRLKVRVGNEEMHDRPFR
jgi:hypothetical protein